MAGPTREELDRIAQTPRGTYALMLLIAGLLFVGWALLFFGRFLGAGPVR
jgi:hypothetical protein